MILAIVLTLILAIALFYAMRAWYQNLTSKSDGLPSSADIINRITNMTGGYYDDWTGALNIASHRSAVQNYCTTKGYDYEPPANAYDYGSCLYNKQTCESDSNPHWKSCRSIGSVCSNLIDPTKCGSNSMCHWYTDSYGSTGCAVNPGISGGIDNDGKPCDPYQHPYLEWHTGSDGLGRCTNSSFPPALIQNVCQAKGLGDWYQSNLVCDSSGYCNIDTNDIPSCYITSDYCDGMGLDYQSDGGKGNCNLSDWQNILENIAGKTITRTYKKNIENMIRECKSNPFSANCAAAMGTLQGTLGEITLETEDKEFSLYLDNMKSACSGDIYASVDSFSKCGAALIPGMFIAEQGVKFVDGMLDGCLGWIPGMPKGLLEKGAGYIAKYGKVALNALYHAGEDAIKGFDIAGDVMYAALDKVGLGPVGDVVRGVIANVLKYGAKIANVIANVAKEVIGIFVNVIAPAAYHVFHAVVSAALHPIEFFKSVGSDIAGFFRDPIGSISAAFTDISKLSSLVAHTVSAVLNYLNKTIIGAIDPQLAADLSKIANVVSTQVLAAAKKAEAALEDAAKDVAGAISSFL